MVGTNDVTGEETDEEIFEKCRSVIDAIRTADPSDASPGAESAAREPGGEVVEDTGGTGGEDRRYQPPVAGLLRAAAADLHQPPPALHYRGRTHHAGRPYHRRAPHQRGGLPHLACVLQPYLEEILTAQ